MLHAIAEYLSELRSYLIAFAVRAVLKEPGFKMVKTQALVHSAPGEQPTFQEVELDGIMPKEVLVRMVASG